MSGPDETHRWWRLPLAAVARLHERGHTGIRAIPHDGPVGYWRLLVSPAVNLRGGTGPDVRSIDDASYHSTGAWPELFGLEVGPRTTVDDAADALWRRLGEPRGCTYHDDEEYVAWYAALLRHADRAGSPPTAFGEYSSGWTCGGRPVDPPPGWAEDAP